MTSSRWISISCDANLNVQFISAKVAIKIQGLQSLIFFYPEPSIKKAAPSGTAFVRRIFLISD
jgi:hypothetical protein